MDTDKNTSLLQTIRQAGLTESQAKGYLALIEHGNLTPMELGEKTGESRTNAYMICEKLESLGLASKKDGKKAAYQAENPTNLRQLLVSRQRQLKTVDSQLTGILPQLLSTYRLRTDKPGILYLEGVASLQQIYDDVIKTGETLRIFPSSYDRDDPETSEMIDAQIARQRQAGIKTEVLLQKDSYTRLKPLNDDLFESRPANFGALDTQILIYGNNVAMTTFSTGVVTSIITSPAVAQTFRQLFLSMWDQPHPGGTGRDSQ